MENHIAHGGGAYKWLARMERQLSEGLTVCLDTFFRELATRPVATFFTPGFLVTLVTCFGDSR